MRFMSIAYATRDSEAGRMPDPRLMAAIGQLGQELAKTGVLVEMGGLAPSAQGTRFHLSNGRLTVTDGPFTEAKEIVGGYAIFDVKSKEEAVELCKRFWQVHAEILGPSYEAGGELRPLF